MPEWRVHDYDDNVDVYTGIREYLSVL